MLVEYGAPAGFSGPVFDDATGIHHSAYVEGRDFSSGLRGVQGRASCEEFYGLADVVPDDPF